MNVSVVGLGKLGLPMAAVFAAKGHHVVGLDVNHAFVASLESGKAPFDEPRLQEMLDAAKGRLAFTTDYRRIVTESDVTFIIVPTPSDASGAFSNEYMLAVVEQLGAALKEKSEYHVVVVTSTVMPGATGSVIREMLETTSGRRAGSGVGLCYNPEFVALGSVVGNMLRPDFLLIGESDAKAGALVESVYETVCENTPAVRRMNFVNAELTKISVNTYVTTKISYANMLADMCDRLPEADVDVVAEALGSDTRIGRKYLRGATGFGGPCFPRDNVAFATLAARLGARADIAVATHDINKYQIDRLESAVTSRASKGATVAVLGMAYKPDTPVIEESQGVMLARRLAERGYRVIIHDPLAGPAAARALGSDVRLAANAVEALHDAEIAVITTPWSEYATLSEHISKPIRIIDCWRVLKPQPGSPLEVIWLGAGQGVFSTRA
ncbi:MAG: nucleotide sugar dehydrogenase [Vulcanimicrobiaceae bacterium]|jgi:UDPglucose 6-dehydrogenase